MARSRFYRKERRSIHLWLLKMSEGPFEHGLFNPTKARHACHQSTGIINMMSMSRISSRESGKSVLTMYVHLFSQSNQAPIQHRMTVVAIIKSSRSCPIR